MSPVVSFYRVVGGKAEPPPDGAEELLGELAEPEDELFSTIELEDGAVGWLIGYPPSGWGNVLRLELTTSSDRLASAVLETMRRHNLTAIRWSPDSPWENAQPPERFDEPWDAWRPDAIGAATPDDAAAVPPHWGAPRVLDSASGLNEFLSGR